MTLPTSGDGSARIRYNASARKWEIRTGNTDRLTVADGTTTVTNDLAVSGDFSSAGGAVQSFTFTKLRLQQNTFSEMTGSTAYVSSSGDVSAGAEELGPEQIQFCDIPMVRSGSILGLVLKTADGQTIKSGAFSASVMVNGANTALTVAANTGSINGITAAKDTYTFNGFQTIGVSLTASADYLSEPDITSASFVATVLVEM